LFTHIYSSKSRFIFGLKKLFSYERTKSNDAFLSIMLCCEVQASIAFPIPVKKITIILQKHIKTLRMVVPARWEQRCRTIFICVLDQIVYSAKLAKQSSDLLMTIAHTMV
jgi:hypothetical protein